MDRDSEEWKKLRSMDAKEYNAYQSPNNVKKVPKKFKEWCEKHEEKLTKARKAKKLPYFVKDNEKLVGDIVGWKEEKLLKHEAIFKAAKERHAARTPEKEAMLREYWEKKIAEGDARRRHKAIMEAAKKRHEARTEEQKNDIQRKWDTFVQMHQYLINASKNAIRLIVQRNNQVISDIKHYRKLIKKELKKTDIKYISDYKGLTERYRTLLKAIINRQESSDIQNLLGNLKKGIKIQQEWIERNDKNAPKMKKSLSNCRRIKSNFVRMFHKDMTEEKIISNLGGGDETGGSCASLALAYVGNKSNYNVLDFRGGKSQKHFSNRANLETICSEANGIIWNKGNDIQVAHHLFSYMKKDKEYLFAVANHAAIIRLDANNNKYYLELQSKTKNGFHQLDDDVLISRFGADSNRTGVSGMIFDISNIKNSRDFKKLLSYINTPANKQKKGSNGKIK